MTDTVEIEIDGKKLQAKPGSMVIHAADEAGITIPRFCYHKKLSIAANCRMCLVEVEKSGKPLPACATPVMDGMKVHTLSEKARHAQKTVMEFLLINHPLDCPVCDQGGQCELQDYSLQYGKDNSDFNESKRAVPDENLGSLISTKMTRCIHCSRCIRFGEEIAGLKELGMVSRGESSNVSTYVKHTLQSELSGNIVELCPVGALNAKPSHCKARAWELLSHPSIAPHDGLGSNLYIHHLNNKVYRVASRENDALNETWLSDRDRFSYEAVNNTNRATEPMIKQNGAWRTVDWQTALNAVVNNLHDVIDSTGPNSIASLIAPHSTVEEGYLMKKLFRGMGSDNVDFRLRENDFKYGRKPVLTPGLSLSLSELEDQDLIIIFGSDLRYEQPLINHRVRQASLKGANVIVINPVANKVNFTPAGQWVSKPHEMTASLSRVLNATGHNHALTSSFKPDDFANQVADFIGKAEAITILSGAYVQHHPVSSELQWLIKTLAEHIDANVGYLVDGGNAYGLHAIQCVPSEGFNTQQAFSEKIQAYILMNVEPECDVANPANALKHLNNKFVVSLSPFLTESIKQYADVILPVSPFTETDGTQVNFWGQWQSFKAAVRPYKDSKPAWKVLRVLGNLFEIEGFDYNLATDVSDEAKKKAVPLDPGAYEPKTLTSDGGHVVSRITAWPIYRVDNVVRQSKPLQEASTQLRCGLRVNRQQAKELGLVDGAKAMVKQAGAEANLTVIYDESIPDDCVYIPGGFHETSTLGDAFGAVTVEAM